MKAIIIDDERRARHLLSAFVAEYCPEITATFQAEDLEEGVKLIQAEQPQIVFLDIEMPRYSGLQILEFFPDKVDFQLIFTTAYNQYAVEAFKLAATDYLLKPIDPDELQQAVQKAVKQAQETDISAELSDLKRMLKQLSLNKIALEVPKGILFVSHDDIILFEADGMYTTVYLQDGSKRLISKPLKHFMEQLENNSTFFRCHRSFLVNLRYVAELSKSDGDFLTMTNRKIVPISKSKKQQFMELVKDIFW